MLLIIQNGVQQTTGSFASVATGTSLKTLMQVVPLIPARIVEWGITFNGSSAATPGMVELMEVDAGATITQYAAADIVRLDADALQVSDPTTRLIDVSSVTKSGYTASGEGSITAARTLDLNQFIAPTTQYSKQFPLGDEPFVQPAKFLRIRVLFGTTVNATCFVKFRM